MKSPLNTSASPANKALVVPLTAVVAWTIRGTSTGDWTDDGAAAGAIATLVITAVVWLTPNRPRVRANGPRGAVSWPMTVVIFLLVLILFAALGWLRIPG